MTATDDTCARWLSQARIAADRLTAEQRGLLQAAFAFRQRCGDDYYSSRLLSHFLLHCDSGLKVAQIARLGSASAGPRPRTSKASLPRRPSRPLTIAWPVDRTANCCHVMP